MLRRTDRVTRVLRAIVRADPTEHVLPAIAAATWSLALSAAAPSGLATQRGLVFVIGPLVLLATLHARTGGYLHAPGHLRTFALPIDPRDRFEVARTRHLAALAMTIAWGIVAVTVAAPALGQRGAVHFGLVLDWLALAVFSAWVEPFAAAIASYFGRRLGPQHPGTDVLRSLGGGWTLPEAVVHLYAPALGLGLATALAMPDPARRRSRGGWCHRRTRPRDHLCSRARDRARARRVGAAAVRPRRVRVDPVAGRGDAYARRSARCPSRRRGGSCGCAIRCFGCCCCSTSA